MSACSWGDPGSIPGLGRSPGVGNGNHSSFLAWKIPWTEEPGWLQSMGLQRVGQDLATSLSLVYLNHPLESDMMLTEKAWVPSPPLDVVRVYIELRTGVSGPHSFPSGDNHFLVFFIVLPSIPISDFEFYINRFRQQTVF